MKSLFMFLWNGFGLGSQSLAARATGMALCFLLLGVFIAYFIVAFIFKMIMKLVANRSKSSTDDSAPEAVMD